MSLEDIQKQIEQAAMDELKKKFQFIEVGSEDERLLALTDEQAEQEYGTPDSPPVPWLGRALRGDS